MQRLKSLDIQRSLTSRMTKETRNQKYCLRDLRPQNYRNDFQLPRLSRCQKKVTNDDKLYPVDIIEKKGNRVKIHYIGYEDEFDEWREEDDVVRTTAADKDECLEYKPFSLYEELRYQIKLALDSKRKDPEVRIEIPFDVLLFNGGLKQCGVLKGYSHGHEIYSITSYKDLKALLGDDWWYRCLNEYKNFCYIHKETVQYYLHRRKTLTEFTFQGEKHELSGGHILVFKFVRMDGVEATWERIDKA